MTLADVLLVAEKRPQVIADCCRLLDAEVASKRGVSGLAIKGGYGIVKKIKPTLITEAFDDLLDDFAARLDPIYAAFHSSGGEGTFVQYLSTRGSEAAEALLGITDDRAARAENKTIKKTYAKLRPYGKKNVQEAIPAIGALIDKYAA